MKWGRRHRARLRRLFQGGLTLWPSSRTPFDPHDYETLVVNCKIRRALLEEADSALAVSTLVADTFAEQAQKAILLRMRQLESEGA